MLAPFGSGDVKDLGPHLEQALVRVFLADTQAGDVAVLQLALVRLQEVERGQTAANVVVGFLGERQQRRQVRFHALLPGDAQQTLSQPGGVGGWKLQHQGDLAQRPQSRRVEIVANTDDRSSDDSRTIFLPLCRRPPVLGPLLMLQNAHQIMDRSLWRAF